MCLNLELYKKCGVFEFISMHHTIIDSSGGSLSFLTSFSIFSLSSRSTSEAAASLPTVGSLMAPMTDWKLMSGASVIFLVLWFSQ